MASRSGRSAEVREGVELTNLDQALFDGAGATKRDLVDYLDAASDRFLPELRDRALSVVRTVRGQAPFMQKNLPAYAPEWVARVEWWAEASKRSVSYALCNDRPTLLWFANQRAVEYHVTLVTAARPEWPTHLVLDLDPPEGSGFAAVVAAAKAVRAALAAVGLDGAVKTSGAKGLHVVVPVDGADAEACAWATRALARRTELLDPDTTTTAFLKADRGGKVFVDATRTGGATVIAAYSPRIRPGVPVSWPVPWADLDEVTPAAFTIRTVPALMAAGTPWHGERPAPQAIPQVLLDEGREIPVPRVAAMHEGRRRAARARAAGAPSAAPPSES